MDYETVMQHIAANADPAWATGMARFGIVAKANYGVRIPTLRKLARQIGTDHDLAQDLWESGIRETRILASMVDDPQMVTQEQMEHWTGDFDTWEVCDNCCGNLFDKTAFAREKCLEWASREDEFVKRAGFALMATLAVHDKAAEDRVFEEFFPAIEREAGDSRNFVKKAVSWALRQIGKRHPALNRQAVDAAHRIRSTGPKSARWVASDALRELTSDGVQQRLKERSHGSGAS